MVLSYTMDIKIAQDCPELSRAERVKTALGIKILNTISGEKDYYIIGKYLDIKYIHFCTRYNTDFLQENEVCSLFFYCISKKLKIFIARTTTEVVFSNLVCFPSFFVSILISVPGCSCWSQGIFPWFLLGAEGSALLEHSVAVIPKQPEPRGAAVGKAFPQQISFAALYTQHWIKPPSSAAALQSHQKTPKTSPQGLCAMKHRGGC